MGTHTPRTSNMATPAMVCCTAKTIRMRSIRMGANDRINASKEYTGRWSGG